MARYFDDIRRGGDDADQLRRNQREVSSSGAGGRERRNFYGTTPEGGANGSYGTVFRVTLAGVLTTLVSFSDHNGRSPEGGLVKTSDGDFYERHAAAAATPEGQSSRSLLPAC